MDAMDIISLNKDLSKNQILNGGTEMNKRKGWIWMVVLLALVLPGALLAGCAPQYRVGAMRSESQSVELGDAESVRGEINFGAGDLKVTGGAEKLVEADYTYNVARLKPEMKYTDGRFVIRQPGNDGMPDIRGITDFRNQWNLRFNDTVPMDLRVEMGAGNSDLQLAGLSLTGLDISLGAGISTVDLSGDWAHDLDVTIDAGASNVTVQLPRDVGVRIKVDRGPTVIQAPGLTKEGNIYTNAAYGVSDVTMQIDLTTGIGWKNLLEVGEPAATLE
jgi:hypothetical protein